MVVALIGVAATSFPITVLSAALPDIAADLDTSNATITWVISAPLLAFAVFTPMAGKLGDLHGHRRMYLWGFTGAAVGSLATAFSPNAAVLIALRVLSQAAASSTGPSALAILMSVFPDERRTWVAGIWSGVLAASPALGVALGGPLIDATSWRVLFVIQGVGSAVAVLASLRVLPSTPRRRDVTFDLPGGIALGAGVGSILFALNRSSAWGWTNPFVIAGLSAGPVLLALFVLVERRTDHPLVHLPTLRRRNVAAPIASQLFLNGPYMAGLVLTALMLSTVFDYDTTTISLTILPRPIAFAAGAWTAGAAAARFGGRTVVVSGTTLVTASLVLIGTAALTHATALVVVGVLIAGAGSGFSRPPIIAALTEAVGEADMGVGTGLLNMTGQIGAAAGISLLTAPIGDAAGGREFFVVFVVAAVVAVLAIVSAHAIAYDGPVGRPTPAAPSAPWSTALMARLRRNGEATPPPATAGTGSVQTPGAAGE